MNPVRHLECDGAVMPALTQDIFLIFGWSALLVLIVIAVRMIRTRKDDKLLIMVLAGTLATPVETFNDFMVYCCFPPVGSYKFVYLLGTVLSWFEPPFYGIYIPLSAYVCIRVLRTKLDPGTFWLLVAANVVFDWAFEVVIVKGTGIWFYFGDQPMILGVPLIEPFVIATLVMAFAATSLCCLELLKGYRRYILLLVGSLPFGGAYLMCWPVTAMLSGGASTNMRTLAAMATLILSLSSCYVLYHVIVFIMGHKSLSGRIDLQGQTA